MNPFIVEIVEQNKSASEKPQFGMKMPAPIKSTLNDYAKETKYSMAKLVLTALNRVGLDRRFDNKKKFFEHFHQNMGFEITELHLVQQLTGKGKRLVVETEDFIMQMPGEVKKALSHNAKITGWPMSKLVLVALEAMGVGMVQLKTITK